MWESSWTKDWTGVPCTDRQILNHWTSREVPLEAFWIPSFWGFMETSLTGMLDWIIGHWWLIQPLAPLPNPEESGWNWKFQPSNHMVHSPGNQPPFLGSFQKPPTDRNLGVTARDLIWIIRHRFCLYGSGAFSEMRTQEQLFEQKMLHRSYHLGNFKDFWSCEPRMEDEDQMYISYYKSQHHSGEIWSNWRQPPA